MKANWELKPEQDKIGQELREMYHPACEPRISFLSFPLYGFFLKRSFQQIEVLRQNDINELNPNFRKARIKVVEMLVIIN